MAAATLAAGALGDRVGRRRSMVVLGVLTAAGVAAVALAPDEGFLLAAAFVGMLNGAGRDRGALPALEQAALAGSASPSGRTRAFAVYNVFDDAGLAAGALLVLAARVVLGADAPPRDVQRVGLAAAAVLALAAAAL